MARPLYSLRIFGHASLTSSAGVVGPLVPSGLIYVLRDIDVDEISGTLGAVLVVQSGVLGALWAAERTTTAELGIYQWRGRQVYREGEMVGFHVLSGTWSIAASGYQLTVP